MFDSTVVSQAPPKLTDAALDFGLVGLFHKKNEPEQTFNIETIPEHSEVVPPKFQFFASDAMMNSYLYSLP